MMLSASLVSLLAVSVLAVPTPIASTEEQRIDLLKRAGVATVYSKCTTPNTVALTFDDGPYIYNKDIVDKLDAAEIKGTFFWNGNNYECIYSSDSIERVKYAFAAGHQVASHTWSHADLSASSSQKIQSELSKIDNALLNILGVKPAFMRPPYGNVNELAKELVGADGQSMVLWDFDSLDSDGASAGKSESLYSQKANAHPNNILALNHETYPTTAYEVLPYAIQVLQAQGYSFATVAECLGMEPYLIQQEPGTPDASWHC